MRIIRIIAAICLSALGAACAAPMAGPEHFKIGRDALGAVNADLNAILGAGWDANPIEGYLYQGPLSLDGVRFTLHGPDASGTAVVLFGSASDPYAHTIKLTLDSDTGEIAFENNEGAWSLRLPASAQAGLAALQELSAANEAFGEPWTATYLGTHRMGIDSMDIVHMRVRGAAASGTARLSVSSSATDASGVTDITLMPVGNKAQIFTRNADGEFTKAE